MRIDRQYVQALGAELTAAQVAVLQRVYREEPVVVQGFTDAERMALAYLEGLRLVLEERRRLTDANGNAQHVLVVRLTPLGRDVLRDLPRQGVS